MGSNHDEHVDRELGAQNSQMSNEPPNENEPPDEGPPSEGDVPELISGLCNEYGLYVPPNVSTITYTSVYAPMLNGRCLACHSPLAENTMAILTKHGITMLFCGGQCLTDYNVMGWLSEQYDDMKQAMEFRGGNADG
jgi:hypothetical protein